MKQDTHMAVCAVLARHFGVDPSEIELRQELRRDWGLSGHELMQLMASLERRMGVQIRRADLALVTTVAQLIRLLEALQARSAFEQSQHGVEPWLNERYLRAPR